MWSMSTRASEIAPNQFELSGCVFVAGPNRVLASWIAGRTKCRITSSSPFRPSACDSVRQTKVLQEQADRYGIPFSGPAIDLPKVARALHDFLAANAQKRARDDDPMMAGGGGSGSVHLENYRKERAALAKLDRLERQRRLLPRDQVRAAMGRGAAILRGAGDALERQFGSQAVDLLHEALDGAARAVDRSFAGAARAHELTGGGDGDDPQEDQHRGSDPAGEEADGE